MTRARTPSPGRPSPRRPRRPAGPRRWPELVAATLVLALGVGLGSLLLGERRAPAEPVAAAPQPTTSIPVSPGAVVADGSPQTAAPAQAQTTAGKIPPAPAAPPAPKIPPPSCRSRAGCRPHRRLPVRWKKRRLRPLPSPSHQSRRPRRPRRQPRRRQQPRLRRRNRQRPRLLNLRRPPNRRRRPRPNRQRPLSRLPPRLAPQLSLRVPSARHCGATTA